MHIPLIALIGRPNVGKSALFNRLSADKKAMVHDIPGVTRDRKYSLASLGSLEFTIIDTPGLEEISNAENHDNNLKQKMLQQAKAALVEADIICLIIDSKEGVTIQDQLFANIIRQCNKPIVLIANKCEKQFLPDNEYYKLGFGEPVAISAVHNLGMMDLHDRYADLFNQLPQHHNTDSEYTLSQQSSPPHAISVAIVGRPNAGKSTFVNAIIGDSTRLITGQEAGMTRESIEISWNYQNTLFKIVDTAGLRKKNLITNNLEKFSASDTIRSINFANVVLLMLDATRSLEQQDLNIANYCVSEGRCLIVVVNKWDLIHDKISYQEWIRYKIDKSLSQVSGVPIVFISAKEINNLNHVLDESIKIYSIWNQKIQTHKLNKWIKYALEQHPPHMRSNGRRIKIKYITQINTRPPTFKMFCNYPEEIEESYIQYLKKSMRKIFKMDGIPLRFILSKTKNPYVTRTMDKE